MRRLSAVLSLMVVITLLAACSGVAGDAPSSSPAS